MKAVLDNTFNMMRKASFNAYITCIYEFADIMYSTHAITLHSHLHSSVSNYAAI